MTAQRRVQKQAAFVLHRRPFSESSLLVDAFSRDYGRVALLAKGARRLKSPYRALLQCFHPLSVGWSGKRELLTLTQAESSSPAITMRGKCLMCAWYANELLTRFLHRGDPHERLFDAYTTLLLNLGSRSNSEWALRLFEKALLRDVGYGLVLDHEVAESRPIEPETTYKYVPDSGPIEADLENSRGIPLQGQTLLALHHETMPADIYQREAKRLIRVLLFNHLEGRLLRSRAVFRQMYGTPLAR